MNDMIKITCIDGISFLSCNTNSTKKMVELINKSSEEMPKRHLVCEVFEAGKMPLEALPELIQHQVKSVLRAYPRCTVTYEHNEFSVSSNVCIRSTYGWDHFVAGVYKDVEVYSLEERRQNFKEEFGYAPFF